jgi:hypothetical protein
MPAREQAGEGEADLMRLAENDSIQRGKCLIQAGIHFLVLVGSAGRQCSPAAGTFVQLSRCSK